MTATGWEYTSRCIASVVRRDWLVTILRRLTWRDRLVNGRASVIHNALDVKGINFGLTSSILNDDRHEGAALTSLFRLLPTAHFTRTSRVHYGSPDVKAILGGNRCSIPVSAGSAWPRWPRSPTFDRSAARDPFRPVPLNVAMAGNPVRDGSHPCGG